jgi:hypothetical protein
MFYSNNFTRDSSSLRYTRLLHIERNSADYAIILALTPEIIAWAGNCMTSYSQSRQDMALAENERQEATALLHEQLEMLDNDYQVAALFARQLYADIPDYVQLFDFDKPMPRTQSRKQQRVTHVLNRHSRMVAEGIHPQMPAGLMARLDTSLQQVKATTIRRFDKSVDARQAAREHRALWSADTKLLRLLYAHCVMVWGDNDPTLNAMGFAMREQVYGK